MKTEMNTRFSNVQDQKRGVILSIGCESTLILRTIASRPNNEDLLRGIQTTARKRGNGMWIEA